MARLVRYARENGWPLALARALDSSCRKLRDRLIARKLGAPGFRAGGQPKLLGLAHMRVGAFFSSGDNLWLEAITEYGGQDFAPQLVIGSNVSVSDRVHIACLSSVTIGDGVLIGSGSLVSDHQHGAYRGAEQSSPEEMPARRRLDSPAPVRIGSNVWLGDRVSVLAGADIGSGAVIGAGSMVNGVIPPNTIAVGSPAKPIRRWDETRRAWIAF